MTESCDFLAKALIDPQVSTSELADHLSSCEECRVRYLAFASELEVEVSAEESNAVCLRLLRRLGLSERESQSDETPIANPKHDHDSLESRPADPTAPLVGGRGPLEDGQNSASAASRLRLVGVDIQEGAKHGTVPAITGILPFAGIEPTSIFRQDFHSADGRLEATVEHLLKTSELELRVRAMPDAVPSWLCAFTLSTPQSSAVRGFVGLYDSDNLRIGSIGLGRFFEKLRQSTGSQEATPSLLALRVHSIGASSLTPEDESALRLSEPASPARCQPAIRAAISCIGRGSERRGALLAAGPVAGHEQRIVVPWSRWEMTGASKRPTGEDPVIRIDQEDEEMVLRVIGLPSESGHAELNVRWRSASGLETKRTSDDPIIGIRFSKDQWLADFRLTIEYRWGTGLSEGMRVELGSHELRTALAPATVSLHWPAGRAKRNGKDHE